VSKWVGSKTPSNLVNLRAGEFARRQHCARGRGILLEILAGILPEGRKSRAGMRLYRGTITEDLGCLMARWRPTIVTSRLGRGGAAMRRVARERYEEGQDEKASRDDEAERKREREKEIAKP